MRRATRLTALWLAAFTISPTLLTACSDDDDASTDDDSTGDDDDDTSGTDDDDVTDDDDDVTGDDDDLPFCETITTQSDCEARKDCFAFIEYTWWYLDAVSEQCKQGQDPVFVDCRTRGASGAVRLCRVFPLPGGGLAVATQEPPEVNVPNRICGLDTSASVCECCRGGEG